VGVVRTIRTNSLGERFVRIAVVLEMMEEAKALVSSSMIDRVVEKFDRQLLGVPVAFKWLSA
jgi:phosphoglucomutase